MPYLLPILLLLGAASALLVLREARIRWRRMAVRLDRLEHSIGQVLKAAERDRLGGATNASLMNAAELASRDAAPSSHVAAEARKILRAALERLPPPRIPRAPVGHEDRNATHADAAPEVTVVIPVYNDERFIGDAIASLKNQTIGNFAAILVDDASSDRSAEVALMAIGGDPRFSLARHQRNSGPSAARNTGLRLATRPFIMFLDADDFLLPNALELRIAGLAKLTDRRAAGVYSGVAAASEDVDFGYRPKSLVFNGLVKTFVNTDGQCPFNPHAPTLRTEVLRRLGGFDETLRHGCEDWEMWQRLLRHGYRLEPVNSVTAIYRSKRSSMVRRMPLQHLRAARRIFDGAHRPLADAEVIPGTPYVYRESVAVYHEQAAFAGRTAQYAAMAYLHDADDFREILNELPDIWRQIEDEIRASSHVQAGIQRFLAASDEVLSDLRTDIAEVTSAVLLHLRDAAASKESPVAPGDRRPAYQVAFFAFNRRQAEQFAALTGVVAGAGFSPLLVSPETVSGDQGVETLWNQRGCPFVSYNTYVLQADRLSTPVCVVMRPYDGVVGELVHREGAVVIEVIDSEAPVSLPDENQPAAPHAAVPAAELLDTIRALLKEPSRAERGTLRSAESPARLSGTHRMGTASPLEIAREERLDVSPDYERIAAFRDRYKGERCFIIGNGPSLNALDLSKLRNDHVFAVNGIFHKQDMGFDPSFYVVEDSSVMTENLASIQGYRAGHKFFPTTYKSLHPAGDNVLFFRMNRGFYERSSPSFCVPKFSLDAANRLYCGQSVTFINLQLAYYFGFKTVYLIGMDFSYVIPRSAAVDGDLIRSAEDDPNHFHPAYFGPGKTWHDPKLHRVLLGYELARDIYSTGGREVVNATRGGKLEVFRRVPYESLF